MATSNDMATLLLTLFIAFCCISEMNSFTLKRSENSNDFHGEIIQNSGQIVEPTEEYMNKITTTTESSNLYKKKSVNKRDASSTEEETTEASKINDDLFDMIVFPSDDIYGYQPEVVNYEVEYVTANDKTVKLHVKTKYGDQSAQDLVSKKYKSLIPVTKKTWDPLGTVNFGSNWTKKPTIIYDEISSTTTIQPSTISTSNDKEVNSTNININSITDDNKKTEKFTFLDASNGFGLGVRDKLILATDIKNNTVTVNRTAKSFAEYYLSLLSSMCEMRCFKMVLNHYDPVCGSDGKSYWNYQKLDCVKDCGRNNITKIRNGRCNRNDLRTIL